MILNNLYILKKLPGQKSEYRFDCVASTANATGGYKPFEEIARRGKDTPKRFKAYLTPTPDTFTERATRKADYALTNKINLSSVFIPNLEKPNLGYGDMRGTNDALIFQFNNDFTELKIFVADGQKHTQKMIFTLFSDGGLNAEIIELHQMAESTNVE